MIPDVTPNGVFYLPPTGWLTSFYNPPQKINYHHDDLQEILANGVYHDLAEEELERQVQRNLTMFDNLRG